MLALVCVICVCACVVVAGIARGGLCGCCCVVLGDVLGIHGEFDPGSGRTLAACLTHASRTVKPSSGGGSVANG